MRGPKIDVPFKFFFFTPNATTTNEPFVSTDLGTSVLLPKKKKKETMVRDGATLLFISSGWRIIECVVEREREKERERERKRKRNECVLVHVSI